MELLSRESTLRGAAPKLRNMTGERCPPDVPLERVAAPRQFLHIETGQPPGGARRPPGLHLLPLYFRVFVFAFSLTVGVRFLIQINKVEGDTLGATAPVLGPLAGWLVGRGTCTLQYKRLCEVL